MTLQTTLKPCAHCGASNPDIFTLTGGCYRIGCAKKCGVSVTAWTEAEAIAAWNRRPQTLVERSHAVYVERVRRAYLASWQDAEREKYKLQHARARYERRLHKQIAIELTAEVSQFGE